VRRAHAGLKQDQGHANLVVVRSADSLGCGLSLACLRVSSCQPAMLQQAWLILDMLVSAAWTQARGHEGLGLLLL